MRLKNILIVVKDIEQSKKFYHDLFGLDTVLDSDGNMILTEGLVLQDEKIWKTFLGRKSSRKVIPANCILRSGISRRSQKSWRNYIPPFNTSTVL